MKKNKILAVLLLLVIQFPFFAETLYPAKILFFPGMKICFQNDILLINPVGEGWIFTSLDFTRYNIEENTFTPLSSVNGRYLTFYISEEEELIANDAVDPRNSMDVYYVFDEEKVIFEKSDNKPKNYLQTREIPKAVTIDFLWERIGNYYVKPGPWQDDDKSSFIVVDLEGNFVSTIPIWTFPEVMSEAETIRSTQDDRYLLLDCYLSIDCTDIDQYLRKDSFITILYELIPDDQISFATTEIVRATLQPQDGGMPAYKVTTRTVDASSLIVPLKPDARVLKAADNLRLRKSELTSSDIVTTMLKGTPVKIIATGRQETIDGITGNWVQVEVLSGGKDRNGNPIPEGTTGWCFGGYLE